MAIDEVLLYLLEKGGSDLHLSVNSPPMIRVHGELEAVPGYRPLTAHQLQDAVYAILTDRQKQKFEENKELDLAYTLPGAARFRVNLMQQQGAIGAVLRAIPWEILPLEALHMPDILGEIVVRAPHQKDRYDRLWATERAASRDPGWHRTGDIGHLDRQGRLWVGGRLSHVITTPHGPLAPVGIEQAVQQLPDVVQAAAVGVGPVGTQQVVVVVVTEAGRKGLADLDLTARVRAAAGIDVAAVLERPALPVDIRHNSKVDRAALAHQGRGPARRRRAAPGSARTGPGVQAGGDEGRPVGGAARRLGHRRARRHRGPTARHARAVARSHRARDPGRCRQ